MAYTAKTWVDNSAPSVCAANLNDLETGVVDAHTTADRAVAKGVLQAKGDLIAALSASSPTRVVVGADDTVLVADSAQTHGLKWVQIGNAQVLAAAAIAYSKLNLAGSIVNADVAAGAAIAYSKLSLASSIVNADIASSASISAPKIAGFPADSAKFLRGDATWAAPAAALIALVSDTTLGSAAASIDVQNIAATYEHLQIIGSTRSDSATAEYFRMRCNNDSAANYDWRYDLNGTSAGVSGDSGVRLADIVEGDAAANIFAPFSATVPDYKNSARHKGYISQSFGRTGAAYIITIAGGIWKSTVAIDRLTFVPQAGNLDTGSRITIYGLDV